MMNIFIGMVIGALATAFGVWAEHASHARKMRKAEAFYARQDDALDSPFLAWSAPTEAFTPKVREFKRP